MSARNSRSVRTGVDKSDTLYPLLRADNAAPYSFCLQEVAIPTDSAQEFTGTPAYRTSQNANPRALAPGRGTGSVLRADLLHNGRGGAILHQAKHTHFAAIGTHDIGADHPLDTVVTALDQNIRTHPTQ